MVITFQIILVVIIVISFLMVFGYEEDKETQTKALAMFLAGLSAFVVSVLWF